MKDAKKQNKEGNHQIEAKGQNIDCGSACVLQGSLGHTMPWVAGQCGNVLNL